MASKDITFSQYWFLAKKIIVNRSSDDVTMFIDSEGDITSVEYFNAKVKISIARSYKEISVQIKTFGDVKDEVECLIKLPLFHELNPYFWVWKYTIFAVHRAWKKENKNKVNKNVQKINELIAIGFPEEIEKELLK